MAENDMNEVFTVSFADSEVITVPIDDTLSNSGEAADAAAVGAALALKADASSVNAIQVNGQSADNQGLILINGTDIPLSDASGAPTIAQAINSSGTRTADAIAMSDEDSTTVADKIEALEDATSGMVTSVNGETPDENGDVTIDTVPYAQNLVSETSQTNSGTFISRSSGGTSSIDSGDAWLMRILGNSVHTGYEEEVLDTTVTPTDPESDLAASVNRATFISAVSGDGTYTFTYSSSWSPSLETYGITVTGTPANGDVITVVYAAEIRGTITMANPKTFVATGWNLFRSADGYARVVKYSDTYGYKITGAYTALQFSETLNGARTSVTVTSGNFAVPSDGYIWVTGGDSSSTAIYMTWSDWTEEANGGTFAAYSQTVIDFSSVMTSYFPYGLMKVGATQDEINVNLGKAISRIERMAYSAENLATAVSSGREYEYDEDYIYLVKASATTNDISVSGTFSADDHGTEYFTNTDIPATAEILYGNNLKNKLERDVLTISEHLAANLTTEAPGLKALDAFMAGTLKGTRTVHSNTSTLQSTTYRFANGLMVTVIKKNVQVNIASSSGNIYYGQVDAETFPVTYSSTPLVFVSTYKDETNAWIWGASAPSTKSTGKAYLGRGQSVSSKKIWIQWLAVGYKA